MSPLLSSGTLICFLLWRSDRQSDVIFSLCAPCVLCMHGDGLQYEEVGEDVVGMLDGMFSFVLVDLRDKSFIAARDPIGITPLYLGWGNDGTYISRSQTFF